MNAFLYYLPGRTGSLTVGELPEEIRCAFETGEGLSCAGVASGPGGKPGLIVATAKADRVGYYPTEQRWMQIPKTDMWVGAFSAALPGPLDLARATQLKGHTVTLGDGREWLVPAVRGWLLEGERVGLLPRAHTLDADGQWCRGGVLEQFAVLWDVACRWWDARNASATEVDGEAVRVTISFGESDQAAVTTLAANYRVGVCEAILLGLLNDLVVPRVLDAVIDLPTLAGWADAKKKVPAAG